MRTFRSVVAVVSTVLLMACQTATSAGNRQLPAPLTATHAAQGPSSAVSPVSYGARKAASAVAAEDSRQTWLIVALLAAIAVVVAVMLASDPESGGLY